MSGFDIIAIGSGHNGLIAAAYLAKAGQKVLVVERNDYFGGGVATKGTFMHPPGGVTGGGRATAVNMCGDLRIDSERLLAS